MSDCAGCVLVKQIMDAVHSNRGYWLATEIFMEVHDGKDYCERKKEG